MERGQGRRLSEEKINKIKTLLANTEMTIPEISQRMGCSGGPIVAINRRFRIRLYNSRRCSWDVNLNWAQTSNPVPSAESPSLMRQS